MTGNSPRKPTKSHFRQTSGFVGRRNKIVTVTPPTCFLLRQLQKSNKIGHFFKQRNVTVSPSSERRSRLLRGWIVTVLFLRGELVTVASKESSREGAQ
jgi:hypothetical protein